MINIKTVTVKAEKKYKVFVENDLLLNCAKIIKNEVLKSDLPRRVLVVSDSTVAPLYYNALKNSLTNQGFSVFLFTFKAGEEQKTADTVCGIIDCAAQCELDRHDIFAALGGGVAGDLCGLAASLYMRGVKYLQFPTTLLSCVDSAIGGKTACNTDYGKNIMGSFFSPCAVFVDPNTLKTLHKEVYAQGIAEAVKYGLISDRKILKMLCEDYSDSRLIYRCIKVKARFIKQDFYEKHRRKILNFGHTFAHAYERALNYKISHGNAVAIGILAAVKYSQKRGVCAKDLLPKILPVYRKFSLGEAADLKTEDLVTAALSDKKSRGDSIDLVLLKDIGRPEIIRVKKEELKDFLEVLK